jgi:hypothetical protein
VLFVVSSGVVGSVVAVDDGTDVVVVVVVPGGITWPLPQQPADEYQCFQSPLEYRNQAATAVLASGSKISAPAQPAFCDRSLQKRGMCWKSPEAPLEGFTALAS